MKKTIASLILSVALASSAFAGTPDVYSSKGSKTVQPIAPMTPIGCECFAPGAALGIFGGVMLPRDGGSDVGGGGILGEYFFTENIGIQLSYGIYATSSEHHQIDGSLIYRFPIKSLCIAPYLMAGGGVGTNAVTRGDYHAGVGIDARFSKINCMGVFADAAYHFSADSNGTDFTVVRMGVKFPF
jgi:hypothetical protein